jgi:hypothetical protein
MPAKDTFPATNFPPNGWQPNWPARNAAQITPSDTADLANVTTGIYVGTGGQIVAIVNGVTRTYANVVAGLLPIRASRVLATGTTASQLVAQW